MNPHEPIRRVEGHEDAFSRFQTSLVRGRLGSTYLFVGPEGIGKRTFAQYLAAALLCETTPTDELAACEKCPACQQVAAFSHPDFDFVRKPADKSTIPVELLIGDKQHRMREGLCARIAMTPSRGTRKIAVIDDADDLSQEAANCLLKTLEEPPRGSVLILIGTSIQRQLPTIRSRCQVIPFHPLPTPLAAQLILRLGLATAEPDANRLARACQGSLTVARQLQTPDIWEFKEQLFSELSTLNWRPLILAKQISEFVEAGGKAVAKRDRLSMVTDMAAELFRAAVHIRVGSTVVTAGEIPAALDLAECWQRSNESLLECVDRCLIARQQIAMNANQATLIESWVDELWGLYSLRSESMQAIDVSR